MRITNFFKNVKGGADRLIKIFGLPSGASVAILIAVLAFIGIIAFFVGITYRKSKFEKVVGSAEQQAKKIVDNAQK